MRIDPKIEEATRGLLGHVIRGEFESLENSIRSIGDEQRFRECIALCTTIAGYVSIDANSSEWPDSASIRKIAEIVSRSNVDVEFDQQKIYAFLSKSALGFRSLTEVFSDPADIAIQPIYITAGLLLAFCPRGKKIWAYLDDIEEALEASAQLKPSIAPAMVLRAHIPKA